jgi:predicted nucleotidyltransferase component of viral defense system
MISADNLSRLSRKLQTTELNIRREYVQHLFLAYFYQQPQSKGIYFKGGTALRIVYGSPRFSEDLDFGSTRHDIDEIEKAVLQALIEIEREGIKTAVTESKKTSGGYLAAIDLVLDTGVVSIRLEASFREKALKGEVETIASDFMPAYLINVLAQEQLVEGKLSALQHRQKPRDFYDLYFLLQKGLVTPQQKTILRQILPLVQTTNINFSRELKQFLPQSHWPIIKDFKTVLMRTIERFMGNA